MDGGAIAKQRYRYQDMCAMYLALKCYLDEKDTFEHIYCEQDKLDFEIWGNNYFRGYQVKDIQGTLSADETNKIFKYYISKSTKSGKSNRCFYFIFSHQPKHSLNHLLAKLKGNIGIQKYDKRTEKYIKKATSGFTTGAINVDFVCYSIDEIEYLAYATSSKALKKSLDDVVVKDFPSEVIDGFLSRFRNEIDSISTCDDVTDRIYLKDTIDSFIKRFLVGVRFITLEDEGTKEDITKGPKTRLPRRREIIKSEKDVLLATEGEEVKSI